MSRVAVLEPLPVYAVVTDRRGRIEWVNAHNARANGVKPRELIGKRPEEVWPEASREDAALNARVRKERKPLSHLTYGKTRTGQPVWLKVVRELLPGGRILAVGVDTTAEVREAALRALLRHAVAEPFTMLAACDIRPADLVR